MRNWRINIVLSFIVLLGLGLTGQLINLQILKHDLYQALAQGQHKMYKPAQGERGRIFFNNGEALAINVKGNYVFVSPEKIEDKEKTAQVLADILNKKKEEVIGLIEQGVVFQEIEKDLTEEEEKKIKENNLKGVYLNETLLRKYPQGETASQVVGFLGGDKMGQYGLEGFYNSVLKGKEVFPEDEILVDESINGSDLLLTLDYNIQFMAEKLLKRAEEDLKIEGGEIIVIEPQTGKILALANHPVFNPNEYSEVEDFDIFQNGAVQKIYEPGSVFKPITMASAINEEVITPNTTYIDQGVIKIGGYKIYNYGERVWGEKSMTEVLEKSINTGAVFAERQLGHNKFLEYLEKFGFFEPTGIDLQAEIFSENKEFKKGYEINYATASFGQGIEITPIQMARAFCAIANGGNLVKPFIVEEISKKGKKTKKEPEILRENIISQETSSKLTAMLISVTENGYAKEARIPGYYVAGKTGTSQIPWSSLGVNKKGYSDKTWQSFIGFAPAFNPKFLVLIKLNSPEAKTAEYSAVPIFAELGKYIVDYLQIPPDYQE